MKKVLLFLAITISTMLSTVWAYNFSVVSPSGHTLYYVLDNLVNTVSVTYPGSSSPYSGYTKPTGDLVIPETVTHYGTTYSVTSIGGYAFSGCTGLTSVTIPNSVIIIGNNAFYSVTNIVYSGTATGSPWGALFVNSYPDGDFIYSDSTKTTLTAYIGTGTNVIIPNTVTTIGDSAFYNCSGLTSVTIPNSVTTIENNAFYNCSGLTSVTIPNSVTTIGERAFCNCSGLTSVTIPNSVTSIGSSAFSGCRGLTSVTIPNSVTSIESHAFSGCTGLTSVTIPNSVTSIGSYAFYNCRGLTSVTIPSSVTTIGERAFYDCSGLTSVTIPNSVTSIGSYAFYYCRRLTSVTIPNSVTSIGELAFGDCRGLTSVTIPNSVTSIGNWAFSGCSSLNIIRCKSTTPPTVSSSTWYDVPTNINVYVPCGSSSVYSAATGWSQFTNIRDTSYNIELSVNDSLMGTAEVVLNTCDSSIIEATPNNGYIFLNWSDGSTNNPRTLIVDSYTVITANFTVKLNVVSVSSANDNMGVVIGGGSYKLDSVAMVAAIPADGYRFTSWSDNTTANPYTFAVTKDTQLVAYFEALVPDTAFVHDTTYVPVHDTTYITQIDTVTNTVYDTITNTVHDTVTNTVYDTVTNTVYDTIDNFIYDTVYVTETDTLWLFDTIYMHDTIYIYDTIYIRDSTTGIEDVSVINAKIYSSHSRIVVEGADGNSVMLFDMQGRLLSTKQDEYSVLEFEVPISGAYFVKIGNYKAKKVVVIK